MTGAPSRTPVGVIAPTRPRVLVGDDDAGMREYATRLLSPRCEEVVAHGNAALESAAGAGRNA